MLQSVRADVRETALVPVSPADKAVSVDPILTARLARVAAASGTPSPQVIPSAAVLLLPLHIPLSSMRKRKAALPFLMEPHLASPLEDTCMALGPMISEDLWLCAAVARSELESWVDASVQTGPVVPDILAVPVPEAGTDWTLWCGEHTSYIRFADGGGMAMDHQILPDLWRAQRRPKIALAQGPHPAGLEISEVLDKVPDPPRSVWILDLRQGLPGASLTQFWRRPMLFTAAAAMIAAVGHSALLQSEARFLSSLSAERATLIEDQLARQGVPLDLSLPTDALRRALLKVAVPQDQADIFLTLLSEIVAAIPADTVQIRDLRYDGNAGSISLLINGQTFTAIQRAETNLRARGLAVTSGSASQANGGAELQLIIGGPA